MKILHMVSFILLAIGGINWGLVGLGQLFGAGDGWNVVNLLLGVVGLGGSSIESIVYVLVGLSAVWLLIGHKKDCKACGA